MSKRRLLIAIGLIILGIVGLLTRAFWLAPGTIDVETALTMLWKGTGDRPVRVSGSQSFYLLPVPEYVLDHPRITTEHGVTFAAERMTFSFGLTSLITGNFRATALHIEGGDIALPDTVPLPDKQTTEKFVIAFFAFVDRDIAADPDASLQSVSFANTHVNFGHAPRLMTLAVSSAKLTRKANGALTLSANLGQDGQSLAIETAIGARESRNSQERKTDFSIRGAAFDLSGEGSTVFDANLQFLGSIRLNSKNLKSFGVTLTRRETLLPEAAMSLSTKARLAFSSMTLSDMRLKIGASDLSGNVMADFTPATPRLTGTLAATTIDLSDIADTINMKRDALGNWSAEPLPRQLIPDLDMDLRISSETVMIHDINMTGVALSALVRDHAAELTLASANLFDGSLSGKFRLADNRDRAQYDVNASLIFETLDIEKAGIALIDTKRVTGAASGRLALHTNGGSSAEMVGALSGDAVLNVVDNTISGLDLLGFLHRVEARPVGAVMALKSGKTLFDQGQIIMRMDRGVGSFTTAKFTKFPELQVRLGGEIDFDKAILAITGHALGSSAQSADRAIDLPFSLQGRFDDPAFMPDFTNVTKLSGAITP